MQAKPRLLRSSIDLCRLLGTGPPTCWNWRLRHGSLSRLSLRLGNVLRKIYMSCLFGLVVLLEVAPISLYTSDSALARECCCFGLLRYADRTSYMSVQPL